ncbi:MAG TPA: radical SAM protein [Pirellulales bacterium]|nr:radical SAM protein [Pirellulales bacterium]
MHVVLWDTRRGGATKDFAGGFGVGQYPGTGGIGDRLIRWLMHRDRRPVALAYAYLAAIFRRLGHTVEYAVDRLPSGDLCVFHPSLPTLPWERQAIAQLNEDQPACRVLVAGIVAHTLPEAFVGLGVTLVRGEVEQLFWKLDDVLEAAWPSGASGAERSHAPAAVDVGQVAELDALPRPDWSPLGPRTFRVSYDFSWFPTALVQQSRGCALACDYCPYIVLEKRTRFREPENVAAEMAAGMQEHGFQSFKFRDPLFGLDRTRAMELADRIRRLPRPIQFSIETRIDLLREETLRALAAAGLSSITFGVETPDEATLRQHRRTPTTDSAQRRFIALCRELGIRTVAGFMIGFPDDTPERIDGVLRYAQSLGPTFANFNVVTPYPGTEFFRQVKPRIAQFDYSRYSVYTPVLRYGHFTADELAGQLSRCFTKFYFRSRWLQTSGPALWPRLFRRRAMTATAEPMEEFGRLAEPAAGSKHQGQCAGDQRHDRDAAWRRHAA